MSGALKGTSAGWTCSWVTDPPLMTLTKGISVTSAVKAMREIVAGFGGGKLVEKDDEDNDLDDAIKWNKRLQDTGSILDLVKDGQDVNYAYYLFGKPVGIICIIDSDPPYIADLVTHPGVENAGGILMEAAATHSQKRGEKGKLELYSYSDESTAAYRAMGFAKEDGTLTGSGKMTLDPGASSLWVLQNTRWRLKKYENLKYYTVRPVVPPKRKVN